MTDEILRAVDTLIVQASNAPNTRGATRGQTVYFLLLCVQCRQAHRRKLRSDEHIIVGQCLQESPLRQE